MAQSVLNGLAVDGASTLTGRANVVQLVVKANGTQSSGLQEWQSSIGVARAAIRADGSIFCAGQDAFEHVAAGWANYITSQGSNQLAFIANGGSGFAVLDAAKPSFSLKLQSSNGAIIVHANNNAGGGDRNLAFWYYDNTSLTLFPYQASSKVLVVQGTASQAGNLQEWQNSGGSPLATVTPAGLGNFSVAGLQTKHESASTPTGGSSGEVRVGTDKLWVQDAGTWKSAAVSAAGAPSFASAVKWGTD